MNPEAVPLSPMKFVLSDEKRRQQIARSGLERVWRDGHDVVSRMRDVLAQAAALPESAP